MAHGKPGKVYLVGAGPGDPSLLTLRGAQVLGRADVVVHDALVPTALLIRHAPPQAESIPARPTPPAPPRSQEDINRLLIEHARAGRTVVRLKGGDPCLFGRGGEEAEELADAGIPFEIVPGVSSFLAAPASAGIPVTHREYASAVTVVTGHEDPGKPGSMVDWGAVARAHGTKVILMGLERLPAIVEALVAGGLPPTTPVAVIRWGTTARQQTVTGSLADIAEKVRTVGLAAPALAVVGEVVRLRDHLNWFEKRPLFGRRIVVTRRREQAADLTARLEELGAEVLEIPAIAIQAPTARQPVVEALAGLGEYDWIVFSSPNGVSAFFGALLAAYDDIRTLGRARLAAVGPATVARLRDFHVRADAVPSEFLGRHLAAAIAEQESLDNLRILLARAQVANPDVCRELEKHGAIVDDVAFYETLAAPASPSDPHARWLEEGVDWITFTSASTVEHFHKRFPLTALLARHPQLRLASIGPETSKAITALDLSPAAEARPHTLDGLVAALLASDPTR
ncbi:MAG: uroporphyrinogen-III C-methyltransferase [Verrucomicrobiae bacterium]|nr:uroporphyrinogen-III C-methyltransferase [Verrucomicrobiae bacterium]